MQILIFIDIHLYIKTKPFRKCKIEGYLDKLQFTYKSKIFIVNKMINILF